MSLRQKSILQFAKTQPKINEILNANGFELDTVPTSDMFKGEQGQAKLHIARKSEDPQSPIVIKNSLIAFSWYVRSTRNVTDVVKEKDYEILAYLS